MKTRFVIDVLILVDACFDTNIMMAFVWVVLWFSGNERTKEWMDERENKGWPLLRHQDDGQRPKVPTQKVREVWFVFERQRQLGPATYA